ncbi:unnamed protein product [Adineta steineri]|uniref:Uncharacterized protein n=1 Tax=Adineta steineri TaxID=433720 RepID=A0A818M1X4_9BILA|nr:unnamed protein product [Adineta steineri]
MSTTPKPDKQTTEQSNSISEAEAEDIKMFQATRRTGRRNATVDFSEQLTQVNGPNSASEVDKMTPHFNSMSIKH